MSFRTLKLLTILLPPLVIGSFEYIRHHSVLLDYVSMDMGNLYMTILTLIMSYIFATWMFRKIRIMNQRLAEEEARRAVYEERERLARDLHDHIAQTLFFLNVKLKQGRLEEARLATADIDNHLRQAIFNLRTAPEDGTSFQHRLQKWIHEWSLTTGIEVEIEMDLATDTFTSSEEIHLFAIVQEAFTNIRKHSQAKQAAIRLTGDTTEWLLQILDDGIGMKDQTTNQTTIMEAATGPSGTHKYGLSMMQKRANELSATFTMNRPSLGGCEIMICKESSNHNKLGVRSG